MPLASRRQLLAALSGGLAAAGVVAAGGLLVAASRARRLAQPVRRARGRWPTDPTPRVEAAVIVLGPAGGGPTVLDRRCPHLGCLVERTPAGAPTAGFHCPCHGSRFAADGTRIEGPALRGLRRLVAHTESDGAWRVDLPEDGP